MGHEEEGKVRTSAYIQIVTRDAVNVIAGKEIRSYNQMVDILLTEAIEARKQAKNKK